MQKETVFSMQRKVNNVFIAWLPEL